MLRLIASLALSFSAVAKESPSLKPSLDQFMLVCRQYHQINVPSFPAPKKDQTVFVPTPALVGNQARFSWSETQKKLEKIVVDKAWAYIDKKTGEWVRSYDGGRSVFPEKKAIRGIYYAGKVFIVDGHHRALISTYLGSETIPVKIIASLNHHLTLTNVRQYMADNKLSHFLDHRGQRTKVVDLCEMADDPNLELARRLLARVEIQLKDGRVEYGNIRRSANQVIGAKIESGLPFVEFEIADALRRAGIAWSNDFSGEPSTEQLAAFLKILKDAVDRDPESRLSQVLLFEQPTRVAEIELDPALTEHFRKLGCADLLKKGMP